MAVVSSSVGLGAPPLVCLPPGLNRSTFFQNSANLLRCKPSMASMQSQTLNERSPALHAVGFGPRLQPIERKRVAFTSNRTNLAFVPAAALNTRCSSSQGQTQTVTREAPTITKAPAHEKSPKLDDGGSGFPPRDGEGGGGGGGGGGGNFSGGFFLFGFLAFLGFLKDMETDEDYHGGRRR